MRATTALQRADPAPERAQQPYSHLPQPRGHSHIFVESPCPYQPSGTVENPLLILQGDSVLALRWGHTSRGKNHKETLETWTSAHKSCLCSFFSELFWTQ